MAPELTVPALPTTQNGRHAHGLMACLSASRSIRKSALTGIAQGITSESQQFDRLLNRVVHFRRAVDGQSLRRSPHAVTSHIESCFRVTCHRKPRLDWPPTRRPQ